MMESGGIYTMTKILKGTTYRVSKAGHYNFYYPNGSPIKLENNITGTQLSWTCGEKNQTAYKINPRDIPGFTSSISVIWVEKEGE